MIRAEEAEIAEKMTPHIDQISHDLIGVAMRLHSEIGPGLLESVYETLLARRLSMMGYKVERQRPNSIVFDGIEFGEVARVVLLIESRLVVEIQSVEKLHPVDRTTVCQGRRGLVRVALGGTRIINKK